MTSGRHRGGILEQPLALVDRVFLEPGVALPRVHDLGRCGVVVEIISRRGAYSNLFYFAMSGMLYEIALFFVAPASVLRYSQWTMYVAWVVLLLVAARAVTEGPGGRRYGLVRRWLAGTARASRAIPRVFVPSDALMARRAAAQR